MTFFKKGHFWILFKTDQENLSVTCLQFKSVNEPSSISLYQRDVFRTMPNMWDGTFWENGSQLSVVNYFHKKLHPRCLIGFWIGYFISPRRISVLWIKSGKIPDIWIWYVSQQLSTSNFRMTSYTFRGGVSSFLVLVCAYLESFISYGALKKHFLWDRL